MLLSQTAVMCWDNAANSNSNNKAGMQHIALGWICAGKL